MIHFFASKNVCQIFNVNQRYRCFSHQTRITPYRVKLASEREKQNQLTQSSYTTTFEVNRSIHAFQRILTFWAVNCKLTAAYQRFLMF